MSIKLVRLKKITFQKGFESFNQIIPMKNGFENPNQISLGRTLWGVKDFPQGEGDLVAPTKLSKEHMFWAQVSKAIWPCF